MITAYHKLTYVTCYIPGQILSVFDWTLWNCHTVGIQSCEFPLYGIFLINELSLTDQFHLLFVGFIVIFISFVSLKGCNLDLLFVLWFLVFSFKLRKWGSLIKRSLNMFLLVFWGKSSCFHQCSKDLHVVMWMAIFPVISLPLKIRLSMVVFK